MPRCVYHADLYGPEAIPELPELMLARRRFAYGPCTDFFESSNDPHVVAFIRHGSINRPGCVVVMCNDRTENRAVHQIDLEVGDVHADSIWRDFLKRAPDVRISREGLGTFSAIPGVCIYIST